MTDNAHNKCLDWKAGYEEGVRITLERMSTVSGALMSQDSGGDISTVKLLRFAIQDLPGTLEVLDAYGLPLRGEVTHNYSFGKSLFTYGRKTRPTTLGEPF